VAGLGLYLDDAWYCSSECLEQAARRRLARPRPVPVPGPAPAAVRLGTLLQQQNGLKPDVLKRALSRAARSGRRLGEELQRTGAVTSADVLRALAAQAGVGFLTSMNPARLASGPGNLSTDAVRALGLVPFDYDERYDVLRVACPAPLPRMALSAIRELTGHVIEPYLVADELFPVLLNAYGAARTGEVEGHQMSDLGLAAAHVAAAARTTRSLRMAEARCDDYVWVRLEGAGHTEDLWLAAGQR
jgi:hypothetical protein